MSQKEVMIHVKMVPLKCMLAADIILLPLRLSPNL